MNLLLISMGSNDDPETNMTLCRELLSKAFGSVSFSITSLTKPIGDHYKNNFLNQLAIAETNQQKEDVERNLKMIEKQMGRESDDKIKGLVKIDIDLIKWNEDILKKEDWNRSYIADLLPSLEDKSTDL